MKNRAKSGTKDLDLNLDNIDYDVLAAVANSIPSPASLTARTRVTVTTTQQPIPTTQSQGLTPNASRSTNPSLLTQPDQPAVQDTHTPMLLPPSSLSRPADISTCNPFLPGSITDTAWSQQGTVNWISYPSSVSTQLTTLLPSYHQTHVPLQMDCRSFPYTPTGVSVPTRSLSLTEDTQKKKTAAPRRRRTNSAKSQSRKLSLSNSVSAQPLQASRPSVGGECLTIKRESSLGRGLPPLPPNLASDPALLYQIQAAAHTASQTLSRDDLTHSRPHQDHCGSFGFGSNHSSSLHNSVPGGPYFGQFNTASSSLEEQLAMKKPRIFPVPVPSTETQLLLATHCVPHLTAPSQPQTSLPATHPNPPVSSIQGQPPNSGDTSLVDQLLQALQERENSTGDHSPTGSSSGISSAGTNSSNFFATSTAESSPVDFRSLTTFSAPLSPSVVPSSTFPPSPPHTITRVTHHSRDEPQSSLGGSPPRGGPDHKSTKTNPPIDRNGTVEKVEESNWIVPRVPFPSLASMKEYMILEPELRPPNPPPYHPGMELRPNCPLYKVYTCAYGMIVHFDMYVYTVSVCLCVKFILIFSGEH